MEPEVVQQLWNLFGACLGVACAWAIIAGLRVRG